MKKFMIFLLMAFLYLGTCQASNEFTPSSSDVGKSLRHWVSPSVSSSAYAKFKPSSSFVPVASDELTDSIIRVMLVGPTHACPGQTICLTAVVENDYLGDLNYKFRVNGNYVIGGGTDPLYPNRLYVTIDDLGGLDSLLIEYDVEIYSTSHSCKFFRSPAHYVQVYSIHAQLDSVLVCNSTDNGLMCANVFSNGAETPFAYVWYNAATNTIVDTTSVPCKALPVGKYVVEPHFTTSACVTRSDTAEVKVSNGPADGHITMNDITALACNGNQVIAQLSGISANYGAPSIAWSLNGITIPGANDSTLLFSPLAVAGDTTMYILKAEVAYSNYTCKTYTVSDTIQVLDNPTVSIYGDPVVCAGGLAGKGLYARVNGLIDNPTYTWKIDGMPQTINDDTLKLSDVSASLTARDYPYEITVAVVGGNSCAALSQQAFLLYVNAGPSVVVSTNADTVCKNTEVILTAALADNNSTHLTYKWYRKVGAAGTYTEVTDATTAQYTTVITDSTSYKVEVKETDSECSSVDSMTVYVYPDAKPVQQIVLNASDTTVCSGDQVMLTLVDTLNTKNYGEVGTYMWTMNGVEVDDVEGKTYSFVPTASGADTTIYNMVVTATYTTTCEVLTSTVEKNIVVVKSPSVVISGDPIICQDSTVVLYATVHDTVPGSPVQYLWRVDGVDSVGQNKKVFSATLPQRDYPYEITVVVDGGGACVAESNVYSVLIGNNPTVAIGVSAPVVCRGTEEVVLTAHLGDYNMPNLVYQWSMKNLKTLDSSAIATGTSRELTVTLTDSTRFYVRVEQVNSGCFATGDTMVAVYPNPADAKELVLNVDQADACYGAQVTFTAIDTANYRLFGPATYEWSVNGVVVTNASDSVLIFSPEAVDNDSTNYTVHVRAIHTTPCTVVYAEDDTMVTIHRNPSVVISGDPILCQDSTVSLYATVHDTLVGQTVTYLWRVDGVDSVGQNTNHFEATLPQRDYPYEITVVINHNSACEVVSNVYNVLIGINPTVAIEISDTTVCRGEEATLIAHLGDYNMPNLVYQWYYGKPDYSDTNAIAIGTSRALTVPVSENTRYYVRVKQVNSECEAWADTVINVFPQDPAVQPIELLASDSTVCIGGQIAYYVQDTANRKQYFGSDTIPATYRWFVNGFELMTVSGDHFIFSPAAFDLDTTNYLIEVSATYQTECETHVATASDIVTARRNPTVVINGDPMICDTTTVRLLAIVGDTLPGINVQYQWRVDGVDSASMTTNVFETNLPNRDYPYEITVMLNQGSNCEIVSEPFYLYIEDQPEVVVTVDYDTVCKNQLVNLTAHLGNYNQSNLTYQWYVDDTTLVAEGTESTLAYTITNPDFTAFKVVVTQLNSDCQGTGRDTVVTVKNPVLDSIAVTNLQDDIHDAYSYHQYYGLPAYDVCEGASIQVTAYLKDESGNHYIDSTITYKWRRNGVVIEGVNGYRFMEQLAILDHDQYKYVYTVEIDEPYYPNCYSIPTAVHSDTVKVRRNPHVVIGGEHFVCDRGLTENNVLLNAWVDGAVDTGAIYRWYRDGMFEENPYHAQYGAMFLGSFRARYGYNYTFQVEVINGSGCSSWSEPFEVTVMAPPVINITPYADTVCTGGEVTLVSHLNDYNVIDYELQYQWYTNAISDDNLIPGATEAYYTTNVDTTTNYIVKVGYLTENSNMPACVAHDSTLVVVYDRPEIDSIIMSLTEICEGAQVQLTAVMDSVHQGVPGVPYIYEWYRNSEILPGNAATIFDAPMTVDGNEQQYTYSVKVYQNPERLMCESPIYVSSQTLTVYPNPIVAIFGDQHICYTDTIELVANIDTIANPVSTNVHYFWYESGAPIVNLNGDSAVLKYYGAAQDEPYRFTVQVERENSATGCRSYSYEYDVWVYNAPVANVTIVDTAVCEGAEVTVTAHLNQNVPEQTNLEYQWYAKSAATADTFQLVPGATELTYTTTIFETTTFKFEVVHTLSGCFDIDSATINVYPIPVVDRVVMSDTNVCEGSDVIITAILDQDTIGVPGYPYYYEWRRNGELLEGNTATIHDQPMTADGTTQTYVYSVIAYQTPERLACYSELVNSAELTVFGDPRVAIFGDQHVCYTDTISLIANVDTFAYPVGDLHFQWYESGNMITNLNGDSKTLRYYAPAQDEPYRFTVQIERDNAQAGCRMYSTEYDVWVYNAPVANVTIVDTAVCEGAEVTVTAHLNQNVPEQTNLEYQWYAKSAATADTFQLVPGATELTYTTTIFETTTFKFEVVHTLSGCFDIDSATINVYPIPVVDRVVMSDTNVCEGSDVIITAILDQDTIGVPGYPYYYEWRRNGELLEGNTATIHDQPMTADGTTQTYVYSVIAYQTPERLACYSELVNSAELTVFGDPRVAIFGDQHVCYTDTISLIANVDTFAYPVGDLHFQWYESGNMITNLNGDSKTLRYYAPAQDEPYRFTVQIERDNSEAGCRSYSTEYDVWVYNAPVANVTIVDEDVCEGAEVTVTAHLNQNDPEQLNLEYQWYAKSAATADTFQLVPGATELTYTTTIFETTTFKFEVVHTLSGCFDTDSKTINVHPIPVVNYVSMSDTNVCEGAQVAIYADVDLTKGVAGQPYYFEWRRNGELLPGNTQTIYDSPMTVDGNEQTFVYSVIAYQTPERLACYSELVESATLNVYPNPRVAISGDQYVCETDSVFLYASVDTIGRPVGVLHYTWYESGRLRDNMAYGLGDSRYFSEYFYAQDEPYRFTVEVQRDNIAGGCRAYSEEFLVWVFPQPVVNITASETEVCVGGEVTLRANLNNYEFNYANDAQYQWYTVDTVEDIRHIAIDSVTGEYINDTLKLVQHNPIPGATTLFYTAVMTHTQVYGFTATHNLSGCSDYDEITITVNDIPVIVSVENLSGEDTLCPGGRVELHATVDGGVPGGEVYTWYRNGVVLESTGENLIDYPLAVDNDVTMYIYEVVVKQTAAGCESVIDSLSTDTIWVVPNPTIELSGDPIVCDTTDQNIVITANVVSYVDTTDYGYTYQWYENNAPLAGETGLVLSMHKPYRDYPYSFNFEVKNPYGCTVLSEPFLVYVNDNPIVHIAADDTLICENGTVTLTADLYDQNAQNLVYVWYINGDSIPGAYNTTYTTTLTTTSTFTYKAYQRDSHCAAISNEVTVHVVPAPVIDNITVVSVDTVICEGHIVTLTANYSGGDTTDTPVFTWYKDNEVVEGQTGVTFTDYPMSVDNEITTHVYNVTIAQSSSACFSLYDVADEVTVTVRPNPRYTIYGDADVCEAETGYNIILNGITNDSIIATAADYTYTWYESGVVVPGQTTATLAINKPYRTEPYIFKLVVTDTQYGCTSETEDFLVYVSARPIVNVTSTEDTICTNGVVTLTANIYDQNADYLAFTWYKDSVSANSMILGANDPTYTTAVAETTEFFVVVDQLTTGCQTIASTTVKVNDIPVITSVENLSGQDTLCPGGRVELHATISGGVAGGEVYTWYRNGVQLESTGENLIDYPAAEDNNVAQYIYEVTVRQTAAACQSVITAASQDTLWIVPNPTIELAGDPIVCDTTPNNIVITANVVSYLETPYTYQWYENNAPLAGETGLTLTTHRDYRDYPYSFNFAVQNIYGCTVESEPFLVYVNDNPIVGITVDDTMICENGTVTLTADLYDQNADEMVYQWYKDNVAINGAYDLTYTTTLDQTATFKFYAYQRDSHCAAYSNEITVTVVPAPVVNSITVVSVDTAICEGHVVSLHANVTGGDNVDEYVYTWYKDNEIVEGATGADYTDYPMSVDNDLTTHIYNVTVAQASSACFSLYDNATEVEITVRPNPRYTIYGDADVCEEDDITIANINLVGITTDNVIGTTGDYTFTWYESGVEIAGQNTATLAINEPYRHEPYLFKLVVTDNVYGCSFETEEFAVTVGQRPVVVIAVDQDSICEGGNVTLTSTLMNQTEEGIIYQWQKDVNGTWTNIAGAIAPVYVTPALTETTTFRLHVTNTFNGCEANSMNDITVTVKPTPVIDIVNVTASVVCNGGEVTLTATSADQYTGLGDIQYQWYNNGQAIFGADQNVYTTSPLTVNGDMTTYTFGVQVIMSNSGCVSNVDTATVTVYADPTVTITYDNGLTLCEGGVTTLTANPNHAYFTDFTYQWYLHGQPINGANNATYVVENLTASANAYEYTVEITVNNGTQNGCSAMAEPVYVTIVNDPTAYITVNEGVNAICEGGTVTFTVNVNDGVHDTYNPYTYAWYSNVTGNGVVLGTEASFTTSADDAANLYVYYVDVTSAYGCNVQASDTLRIVADPTVTIAVKLGEDTVVCDGGHTTLIATVEGGLGEASYQWYKNGFAIAGANGNEYVTDALHVNETAAYTVSVSQTGIACTATSTQFNVAVYDAIEVALVASSEVNCVGGTVTLTAVATNGIPGDVLTYQWFRNGNPINGANGAQYVTDDNLVAGHYEYQVEVSSTVSGCHVAMSSTIGITVEAEPTVMISSNVEGNAICEGGDITLTANVIYATNATNRTNTYTYTWKWYEGTTLRTATTSEPHYTLPTTMAAGSYNFFVEISSNDGLGCDASSQANLFNVVVKPVPSVILTASADESCQGGDVTLNAVVIPSNLSGIFYWNVNGQQIVSSEASITVNNMAIGTNNISVVFAPNDAQVACQSATTTITHVVNAAPVVTVAATDPTRLSMCVGGTITIAATATGTANSSDHYVWTIDGQTQYGNNGNTLTTQLNNAGIHTISAMVERANGCNSEFSTPIAVTVAEQPTAQLTQIAGFAEMCAGGEITLMAKVSNYSTVNNGVTNSTVHDTYTYTWYRDNAEFLTTANVTVDNAQISETLNTPASYTYSVTITASGYNCQAAHATLDHQIRVVPDPSWSVNQVNPTELCIGGIVTLNAEVTGGVENQQAGRIQWYKTFSGVESEVPGLGGVNTDVPQAAGVYTYVPKYIDYIGAGCNIADATATQVTVNDLPTATFASGHGSVICGHDYQSFATLNIALTGTAPFTFTIMNMTTGESQTIVTSLSVYPYNVNPNVTSIYRIISVSDANGCIGTMDNVADAVVSVSDVQIEDEVVVASCGDYVARIRLQVNASTSTTATATLPDGSTQTVNILFDAYTQQHYVEVQMPAVAGDYMVNIEVDGCSGDVLVRVPADDVTMGVSSTLVDQRWDDVLVVNNNPDNNGGYKFTTYQWYKNGEMIEGATDQIYQEVGGLGGEYSVELDGIRVSDGAHVHFITCGKYFDANSSIRVYPVPANSTQEVTVELNMTDEELNGAILDIYDVRGTHVKTLTNLTPITKVGSFGAQGTYFGRIITGTNEIKTVKFIIVK